MDAQRRAFAQAMTWLFCELIAQRAEEPVAFLAQLGRDHRKYGVTQRHYDSMHDALLTTLRSHLIDSWDDKLAEAARRGRPVHRGDARAADAENAPPFCDGTVIEHLRVTRDISVVRLQLDQPLFYHPGQYVTVQVPQWPRRWRYLSPAIPPTAAGPSSSTSARSRAAWSAPRSSVKPSPVTGGGCRTRTAACRSTATAATC